jgi:Xaa-Pro dipeptidase
MFNANNPLEIKPGMVLFMHMIMFDSEKGLAMCPGETLLVTEEGHERLSRHSLDLVVL